MTQALHNSKDFKSAAADQAPSLSATPILRTNNRQDVQTEVARLTPWLDKVGASVIRGGRKAAHAKLDTMKPAAYGGSRNHVDGAVTRLSPYIRHGVLSLSEVRDRALAMTSAKEAEKLIQQLAWRDYWQRLYKARPEIIWNDAEDYKTGFAPSDYAEALPADIQAAETGVAAIDHFLRELIETGYLHNHARLYVASYICHWRRVKWQAGAKFFLQHLLDGDPASNNLSFQWVASTFSHKPYYFNLENVQKFTGPSVDTRAQTNEALTGSYEQVFNRLFPNLDYNA
ncbi:FAD-binding domain-containing protein [Litorimonas sp. RW-G-Af-16]|uniref:FAD-binding domain-containing protein n=1 Tax=Litorimonas sp. RW-G-Af-16 TaxID=3241168 RepID=UPI00390CC4B4